MPGEPDLQLTLEVDPASDPVRGVIRERNGDSRSFRGWVELISAIEGARSASTDAGASPPDPDATSGGAAGG